jgi:glycosyltransferase involved in cell wall biosynthesis
MKLLVVSHKEIWKYPASPSGYATVGGFPFQMQNLSELFDQTTIIALLQSSPVPNDPQEISGHRIRILPLPEPAGADLRRKLTLLIWLPQHVRTIWREIRQADAVHTPVPGDIGFIGLLITLFLRKPLFVRHCGTWGQSFTLADKVLRWILERAAGGRNVVMATGWEEQHPSTQNPNISWIFSTTLSRQEAADMPTAPSWKSGEQLRLVTVGRLVTDKNIQSAIHALVQIKAHIPNVSFHVVGQGEYRSTLEKLAQDLDVAEAVIFHGNVSHSEVLNILSRSHLFVFPTIREGFPKALLEALSCGLPAVATRVSVIPHLIQDCGFVLDQTTPEEVAKGVLLLVNDEGRLKEMSCLARQRASSYTLEGWRDAIRSRLQIAWGQLRSDV